MENGKGASPKTPFLETTVKWQNTQTQQHAAAAYYEVHVAHSIAQRTAPLCFLLPASGQYGVALVYFTQLVA